MSWVLKFHENKFSQRGSGEESAYTPSKRNIHAYHKKKKKKKKKKKIYKTFKHLKPLDYNHFLIDYMTASLELTWLRSLVSLLSIYTKVSPRNFIFQSSVAFYNEQSVCKLMGNSVLC